jgi:hypothetical protein
MAGPSVLLKCSSCGWKNARQASSKTVKPCAKCGGQMIFAAPASKDEQEKIILLVAGGILFMLVFGVLFGNY